MSREGSTVSREIGRIVSGGYADHQKVREMTMNRIRSVVRHINEGIPFDAVEEKQDEKTFDREYADKNLPLIIKKLSEDGKVSEGDRDDLLKAWELAHKARNLEDSHKPLMRNLISGEAIWNSFLSYVPGIGQVLGSSLIAMMPTENYASVSAVWRNCGLHIVCPVCTEKIEKNGTERTYAVVADREGKCLKCGRKGISPKRKAGQSLDYDPDLRTLAWKIADCLVKQKSPLYYGIYEKEKQKQLSITFEPGFLRKMYEHSYSEDKNPYKEESTKLSQGHAHARALRKMVKIFLQHYWIVSRKLAKLQVSDPYVQEHMGHADIITWEQVLKANGQDIPEELAAA